MTTNQACWPSDLVILVALGGRLAMLGAHFVGLAMAKVEAAIPAPWRRPSQAPPFTAAAVPAEPK